MVCEHRMQSVVVALLVFSTMLLNFAFDTLIQNDIQYKQEFSVAFDVSKTIIALV